MVSEKDYLELAEQEVNYINLFLKWQELDYIIEIETADNFYKLFRVNEKRTVRQLFDFYLDAQKLYARLHHMHFGMSFLIELINQKELNQND